MSRESVVAAASSVVVEANSCHEYNCSPESAAFTQPIRQSFWEGRESAWISHELSDYPTGLQNGTSASDSSVLFAVVIYSKRQKEINDLKNIELLPEQLLPK